MLLNLALQRVDLVVPHGFCLVSRSLLEEEVTTFILVPRMQRPLPSPESSLSRLLLATLPSWRTINKSITKSLNFWTRPATTTVCGGRRVILLASSFYLLYYFVKMALMDRFLFVLRGTQVELTIRSRIPVEGSYDNLTASYRRSLIAPIVIATMQLCGSNQRLCTVPIMA